MKIGVNLSGRVDVYHHHDHDIEKLVIRIYPPTRRTNIGVLPKVSTLIEMNDEQQVDILYAGVDAAGNPATFGSSTWSVAVADKGICSASADGAGKVTVVSEDAPAGGTSVGQTTIGVSVTLADGSTLTDLIAVNVTPSDASSLVGTAGTPTPRVP